MATQQDIEQSVRTKLPMVFGKSDDSAEYDAFSKKFDSLVEYAATVSEPFLRPETTRYQSILLYVSLVFVSISLFGTTNIKLGETLLSVDRKLLLVYTLFITTVAVIFLVKAYVDYERANFTRSKNIQAIGDVQRVLNLALLRRNIQDYFWLEIFDAIGDAYKPFSDAIARSLNKAPDFQPIRMNVYTLDLAELRRLPELSEDIAANEKFLTELCAELSKDVARFEEKAERILSARDAKSDNPSLMFRDDSFQKINNAFDQYLRVWFDARNKLTDENVSVGIEQAKHNPEYQRSKAILRVLKRTHRIRLVYAVLEILAPLLFALVAILLAWLPRT